MDSSNVVLMGFVASLCASMGTTLGSLGVLTIRKLSVKTEDGLLSMAAGIMLAATFFSLLVPALEYAGTDNHQPVLGALEVGLGVFLGAGCLYFIHQNVPHEHFGTGKEGRESTKLGRIWLFVMAITLHNFPEGLAVGVGFGGGELKNGVTLAIGIGLQNFPEGLAVSVALMSVGYTPLKSAGIGILSGLVEPVGGLIGGLAVATMEAFMPWALAFAAGAMLFIISDEIIPQTHQRGYQNLATFSLLIGFVIMMILDVALA